MFITTKGQRLHLGGGELQYPQGIHPELLTQETVIDTEYKNINSKNLELAENIESLNEMIKNYNTDLGPHFGDGISSFKNGIVQPIIIVKTSTKCYIIKADSTDKVTGDTYKNIPEATHRNGPYFTCKGNSNRQKSNVGVMMKHGDTMVFSVTRLKNDPCWARIVSRSFRMLYLLTKKDEREELLRTFLKSTLDLMKTIRDPQKDPQEDPQEETQKDKTPIDINVMVMANILCSEISKPEKIIMPIVKTLQSDDMKDTILGKFLVTVGYPLVGQNVKYSVDKGKLLSDDNIITYSPGTPVMFQKHGNWFGGFVIEKTERLKYYIKSNNNDKVKVGYSDIVAITNFKEGKVGINNDNNYFIVNEEDSFVEHCLKGCIQPWRIIKTFDNKDSEYFKMDADLCQPISKFSLQNIHKNIMNGLYINTTLNQDSSNKRKSLLSILFDIGSNYPQDLIFTDVVKILEKNSDFNNLTDEEKKKIG